MKVLGEFWRSFVKYYTGDASSEGFEKFNKDLIVLCEDILSIVNLSATADKKKVSREGLTYVSKSERIRNAGLNPGDFENDDE